MKTILNKLLRLSIFFTLYNSIKWMIEYVKDLDTTNEALKGKAFRTLLKQYLNMNAKSDWLGRLYGVVNPNLNENGEFDYSNVIIELDGVNSNTNSYIENWFYKKMLLISELFPVKRLFDKINVDIKHIGPTEHDNYLIVFDVVSRKQMAMNLKKTFVYLLRDCAIALAIWYFIFL